MPNAWYRRGTWTAADREDFLARLAGVAEPLAGAQELLELVLANYPDSSQLAYVHARLGECHERRGDPEAAVAAYRAAIVAGRGTPRSSDAHRRLGLLAVRLGRAALYDEVLAALAEADGPLIYPLDQYQHCGIKAIVLASRGQGDLARLCALDALAATKHVRVDPDTRFHRQLEELAKSARA